MPSLFAFLHHVAAFTLVAALAVEFVLVKAIRSIVHWELAGLVVLVFCASLMARGVGYAGA